MTFSSSDDYGEQEIQTQTYISIDERYSHGLGVQQTVLVQDGRCDPIRTRLWIL